MKSHKKKDRQNKITKILCVIYLLIITWIILFKLSLSFQEVPNFRSVNLTPFAGTARRNGQIDLSEVINNIIVFLPAGIYVSRLKPNWNFFKKLTPIFLLSLFFETAQYVFTIGATDITDLLGNTLGGAIGIGIYFVMHKLFNKKAPIIVNVLATVGTIIMVGLLGTLVIYNS